MWTVKSLLVIYTLMSEEAEARPGFVVVVIAAGGGASFAAHLLRVGIRGDPRYYYRDG